MNTPAQTRPILFADGKNGMATQIWATVDPLTFVVARRKNGRSPFVETVVVMDAPGAKAIDVLNKAPRP